MKPTLPALSLWLLAQSSIGLLAQGIPVHGSVAGHSGKPLGGVRIELHPVLSAYAQGLQRLRGEHPPPSAAAFSDAHGEYHLQASQAGFWRLQVHARGYVPMQYVFRQPLLGETQLPTVRLMEDAGAAATVTDDAGKPLSGVGVAVPPTSSMWQEMQMKSGWTAAMRQTLTGPKGRALIPRAHGEELRWLAWKKGLREAHARSSESEVQLTLFPAVMRTVQVVDGQGMPVAGALVAIKGLWPQGLTSEQGLLSVALDPRPAYRLGALLPDGSFSGVFPGFEGDPIVIEAAPGERVSGPVVDKASGRPIADALVWWNWREETVVQADSAGRFSIVNQGAGNRNHLKAAAVGYMGSAQDAGASPGGQVGFLLSPSLRIAGRAVDSHGNPVAGAQIQHRSQSRSRQPWPHSVRRGAALRTLSDGRFFLGPLLAGRRYQVRILGQGFAPAVVDVPGEDPLAELEVALSRGAALAGEVIGPQGAPLAGARIQAVGTAEPGSGFPYSTVGPEPGLLEAYSGSDGRFEVRNLPAGRYDVEITAAGHAPALLPAVEVQEDAARLDVGRVDLRPGTRLELLVTDPQGRPVEGAEVAIRLKSGMRYTNSLRRSSSERKGLTDEQGRFVLDDLDAEERLDISVKHPDLASAVLNDLQASSVQASIALAAGGRLFGRLTDAQGHPRSRVGLSLISEVMQVSSNFTRSRSFDHSAETDRNGQFNFNHVVPGKVSIRCYQCGTGLLLDGISIAEGEVLGPLELADQPIVTVAGRVADAQGNPVAAAEVRISRRIYENGTHFLTASSGLEGNFRFERQPAGKAEISAYHPELGSVRREVEISAAENRFELTLAPNKPDLRVQTVDEGGRPVPGAELDLHQGRRSTLTSGDSEGWTHFSDLEEGPYRLTVYRPGYAHAIRKGVWRPSDAPLPPIEVSLSRGTLLKGHLTGLSLRQLAQVWVTAENQAYTSGGRTPQGVVGHEGDYTIEGLAPGRWTIKVDVGGEQGRRLWETVEVAEGQEEIRLDFDFSQGLELSVLVLRNGQLLPEAHYLLQSDGLAMAGRSGPDGRILLEKLKPGIYSLNVGQDLIAQQQDLDLSGDRELVIDLKAAAIEGLLLDAQTGSPIPEAKLLLAPADHPSISKAHHFQPVKSGPEGRFEFPSVRPDRYLLKAYKRGYLFTRQEVQLSEQSPKSVELSLQPVEPMRLKLRTWSGEPPQNATFYLLDEQGWVTSYESVQPDEDGFFTTPLQAPTGMQLLVSAGGSAWVAADETLGGADGILLPEASILNIQVPGLAESRGAGVVLRGPQGADQPLELRLGSMLYQGQGMLPFLQEGVWQVEVFAEDGRTWSGQATLSPGVAAEVILK